MPIPGTQNAPYFNGKYLTDFLAIVVQHGANAGITDLDLLVPYILQYSSDRVKDYIRYSPEFDPDVPNKTFQAAKETLQLLFGQEDQPPNYTEATLRDYCRDQAAKKPYANKQIESYHREFVQIAQPLVKKAKITDKERDFYFVSGIPSIIKEWFMAQVPADKRTRADPPTIPATMKILLDRFDTETLMYEPWKDESDDRDRKVKFDADGKRLESKSQSHGTRPPTPVPVPTAQAPAATTTVDDLTKMMEKFTIQMQLLNNRNQGQNQQAAQVAPIAPQGGAPIYPPTSFQRRCFICGLTGTHPLHPSKCPETKSLIDAGLIVYDPSRGRLCMPNGDDLPRAPQGSNVADFLRAQAGLSQIQSSAHTHSMGLSYGNERVLKGDVFAVSSLGPADYSSDPVTRSGKDTNRFDPIRKPESKGKQPERDAPPHMPPKQPPAGPSKPKETTIAPPPNPINRSDGWKESLPSNSKNPANSKQRNEDVVMKDTTKKQDKQNPSYHYTSDIQELADPKALLQKIFDLNISVPLFQLIGVSPQLQKLVGEATRVRRDYVTKSAEYSFTDEVDYDADTYEVVSAAHTEVIANQRRVYVENPVGLPSFLERYSSAVARVPEKRFFAMTTGSMTVTIGGVEFSAMIDCGSELNLAGKSVPTRASLAVDFEGMKWSLKGIHGGPEQLQGCATDVPMKIGRHEFPHHLFVSHQGLGQHDIILGQPFLQWFASRIDYDRSGAVQLYLWKDGNRKQAPTIVISITDPADPRNTTTISTNAHTRPVAWVEEVSDEESF